jgi:integrase
VKSKAGRRAIVLPDELYALLEKHELAQWEERVHAGSAWEDDDWMFAQPNGRPIRPEQDRLDWLQLLEDAGVRQARLHDARHTAATVLLLLGVPERAAMEFMGWSHSSMAKRYQHVTAPMRQDIAERLGGFLSRP